MAALPHGRGPELPGRSHAWLQGREALPEATTEVNDDRGARLRAAACARPLLPLLLPTLLLLLLR